MHANESNGKKRLLDFVSTLMDPRLNNAQQQQLGPALTATVALILFLINEPEAPSFKVRRVVATRLPACVRSQAVVAEAAMTAATAQMCLSYACLQIVHTEHTIRCRQSALPSPCVSSRRMTQCMTRRCEIWKTHS